jgi:hypothetical protein
MRLPPREFEVGEIYYMLQYRGSRDRTPLISSYEYKGTVDGKPHTHFFSSTGLSDANVFLEAAQLNSMVDLNGLRKALQ